MSKKYVDYSWRSGITDGDVAEIRFRRDVSVRTLAKTLSIPKSTIQDIRSGKTWTHVPNAKPLNQYKNYVIFPDGRVWSSKTNKFLTPKMDRSGKMSVELSVAGKRKTVPVITLVAKAFLGKKSTAKLTVKDGDNTNVHFTNIAVAR